MKWREILKGVAPTLATAMQGPLAGLATQTIIDKLLGKSNASDSEIYQALINPDGLQKLKQIEADFDIKMKELKVDLERIAVDDRKSARDLASSTSLYPQVVITGLLLTGFFFVLWVLLFSGVEFNETVKMAAAGLLGVLGTNVTLSMKFWFGGSPHDQQNFANIYNSIPSEKIKK